MCPPGAVNVRILSLSKAEHQDGNIVITLAYAPTLHAEVATKDFYESLEQLIRSAREKDRILLLGDMNALVGDDHDVWPDR